MAKAKKLEKRHLMFLAWLNDRINETGKPVRLPDEYERERPGEAVMDTVSDCFSGGFIQVGEKKRCYLITDSGKRALAATENKKLLGEGKKAAAPAPKGKGAKKAEAVADQ